MASLLSFVKNKVQQVEHGVGQAVHDVTHNPVTNAVGNVERAAVHTVAQAPQYLNPVNDIGAAGRFIGATTPHIPTFSNTSPLRFANNAIINPVKSTGIHVSQIAQGHNPYHGSFGQRVGQAGQDALTLATALPIGKGAQIVTKGAPLISKVAQGAKFGVKVGGGFGAAQGLSQSLQHKQNLPQTLKNVGVNTVIGAGAGGVLGAVAPAVATKVARTPLDQSGKLRLPNLFAHNPANQDFHYTAPTNGYTKVSGKTSDVITKLNQVGAVGKDVRPKGLSGTEIQGLVKQNFTPDVISKAHIEAGGKLDATGSPIASDAKVPKISTGSTQSVTPKRASNTLMIPQTSQEGRLTKIASLEYRANKIGESGKGALQTMRNAEVGEKQRLQNFVNTTKPFYKLKPEEQAVAIKVQKGEASTTDPNIKAGADSLQSMFKTAHQGITATGKKVGNLGDNYFPVHYPRGWFDKPENFNRAVQQMVASGKAPDLETAVAKMNQFKIEGSLKPSEFGHFKPRNTDLPGGQENADVVTQYMRGAARATAQAEHFGVKNEILNKHVANAVGKGEDAGALKKIISSYLHPAQPKPGAVTTGLSGYQKALRVVQLPRAAVSHLPQGLANTASDIGYTKYLKALGGKIFKDPETEGLLGKSGLNADDFGRHPNVSDRATAPGLAPLMRFHRDVAFRGGTAMAEALAKKGDVQGLAKLAVDGKFIRNANGSIKLTDEQLIKAGHFEANKSIGSHSILESPAWTQTNAGKAVGMYRKLYTFKQAERIANMFKAAKTGNVAPLARYLAIGAPTAGFGVALAKDEIKDPGSNPFANPGKLAGDTFRDSGLGSVGYGLVDSGINAAMHNYGNDSRWSNLAGAASPGAGFAVQTGQNLAKARNGNVKPLVREGLRMSPVGGTYLADKIAPSDIPKPGAKPTTPTQKEYVSKQEKKGLEKNIGKYGLSQLANGEYAYTLEGNNKVQTTKNLQNARNAIAEDTLKKSGESYKIVGQTVYRKSIDGKVTAQPKIKFDYQVGTATLTAQKNAGDLNGYVTTAQSQLDNINKQLSDPSTDPLEALTLKNQATTLQKDVAKYIGYGGFTKPKAAKSGSSRVASGRKGGGRSSTSSFKVPKISAKKLTAPKGVRIKKVAYKGSLKTRKLTVSKMPKIA